MNKKVLVFIAIFLAASMLATCSASPFTNVSVTTARNMIYSTNYPNLVVMDVRTVTDFNNGHLLGAINVPVLPPSPFNTAALTAWINSPEGQSHKNDEIIVYCVTGARQNVSATLLEQNGFTKVYNMTGAINAWKAAALPLINVTAAVDIKPETLNLKSNGNWITAYIELPSPYNVNNIVVSSIKIGDYNGNGVADLMVKFDRSAVEGLLTNGEERLWITSQVNGLLLGCGGWDSIAVKG
jgi:phage shock protein E